MWITQSSILNFKFSKKRQGLRFYGTSWDIYMDKSLEYIIIKIKFSKCIVHVFDHRYILKIFEKVIKNWKSLSRFKFVQISSWCFYYKIYSYVCFAIRPCRHQHCKDKLNLRLLKLFILKYCHNIEDKWKCPIPLWIT